MTPVVRCIGATRRFQTAGLEAVTAVDGVDLELGQGEFLAIEGPSGSGKSTLLGLIAGIEPADAGRVEVLGHDLARLSTRERARLRRARIGIVFQAFGLLPSLSVVENVGLPLSLDGHDAGEAAERAEAALALVGLAPLGAARIDELSGGERQRVGVARAIVTNPELLLADEPAGNLDDENGEIVLGLLEAARDRGASVLLVTHDPRLARRADRHVALRDGRILALVR